MVPRFSIGHKVCEHVQIDEDCVEHEVVEEKQMSFTSPQVGPVIPSILQMDQVAHQHKRELEEHTTDD